MTISLLLPSITAAIDDISVSGVTIKDYDGVVANWSSQPNVLYPDPENFITDWSIEYAAFNRGSSAPMNVNYTLNYRFLGEMVGDVSQFPTGYSNMITKLILILNAMIGEDDPYSGAVDMEVYSVLIGPRDDPAGNQYFGADIALRIMEMQN